MSYEILASAGNSTSTASARGYDDELRARIDKLFGVEAPRFRRQWEYYRNPLRACAVPAGEAGSERPYRQAQEWGLPSRITGVRSGAGG